MEDTLQSNEVVKNADMTKEMIKQAFKIAKEAL